MNDVQPPTFPQTGFVRVPPLGAIPALLGELGIAAVPVFRSCGVEDEKIFQDQNALLPFSVAGKLLKTCAEITGLPHFGLLVGQRADAESLGAVGLLLRHSPDVITALNELVANLDIHQGGSIAFLGISDEQTMLGYEVYVSGLEGIDQIYDCAMAIGWNILRGLCGSDWFPIEVRLRHSRPKNLKPYRRLFQAPLRFNSSQSGLVFSTRWLSHSLELADPAMRAYFRHKIEEVRSASNLNFREQAQKVLATLYGRQNCTRDDLAKYLDLHPRTLNRRLKEVGTNFRELQSAVCHEIARQLLRDTTRNISAIAIMLGYSDATAFSRSFKNWHGVSPARWRKNARII